MRLLAEVEAVWGKIWIVREPLLENEMGAVTESSKCATSCALSPVKNPIWLQTNVAAKASETKRIKLGWRTPVSQDWEALWAFLIYDFQSIKAHRPLWLWSHRIPVHRHWSYSLFPQRLTHYNLSWHKGFYTRSLSFTKVLERTLWCVGDVGWVLPGEYFELISSTQLSVIVGEWTRCLK